MGSTLIADVSGSLGMAYAGKASEFFKTVLQSDYSLVCLNLQNAEDIDLSFSELLLSFGKSMAAAEKTFIINKLPDDHPFPVYLRKIGLSQEIFQRGNYGI